MSRVQVWETGTDSRMTGERRVSGLHCSAATSRRLPAAPQNSLLSTVLQPSWPPVLPPAWAPSSHRTARSSPTLNPLASPLSSPSPNSTPFHTTNNYVLCPLLPSASQLRPQLQRLFSQESCCTQAVPSPRRQFPPLGGIQLPECSPFFTLGVGRAPRDSSRSTSDHVPGSGITSLVGRRCAVGIVQSDAGGRFWLSWNRPPLTAAPSTSTFCEQGNSPVASCCVVTTSRTCLSSPCNMAGEMEAMNFKF